MLRIPNAFIWVEFLVTLWLSSHEHWFIPTINFGLNCYKTNRRSSSTSRLGLLWWKWLALLKCNHFPGIHFNVHQCTFRCIPVVRYTWLMYPLLKCNHFPGIHVSLCWGCKVVNLWHCTHLIGGKKTVKSADFFDTVILSLFYYVYRTASKLQSWDWILIHHKQFDSILQI